MTVTRWFGNRTRAQEVRVHFSPPNRYRWEFLNPDGTVKRLVVSDGEKEKVYLPHQKKILVGDSAKSYEKLMSEEKETELLFRNYRVSVVGSDKLVGRPVWILEFAPLIEGKFYERLWIDQQSRVILEIKKFRPHGSFAALSRFTRFEPKPVADEAFRLDADSGATVDEHGLDPDFLSIAELKRATGKDLRAPPELPGGFVFESADFFKVKGHTVHYLRYTDGLAVLSVFETDRPVQLSQGTAPDTSSDSPSTIRLASTGKIVRRRIGRQNYTLMGELPASLLEAVFSSFSK